MVTIIVPGCKFISNVPDGQKCEPVHVAAILLLVVVPYYLLSNLFWYHTLNVPILREKAGIGAGCKYFGLS